MSTEINSVIETAELIRFAWTKKILVISITLFFGVSAFLFSLSLPDIYKADALLAPASESSGSGMAALAGNLGGLASLAGLGFSSQENDKTVLAIELLKSREFIIRFVNQHNLLVPLMATKGWDAKTNKLILDKKLYDEQAGQWKNNSKYISGAEPYAFEVVQVFRKRLNVSKDKETGFVTVSFEFYSPQLAKRVVDSLISQINLEVKNRDVQEAQKSIQYLNDQMEKTSISDMKTVFYELIEEQTKTMMFAEVRQQYVFKVLDPAVEPKLKYKPKRSEILILGVLFGGLIGLSVVMVNFLRSKN